MVEIDRALRRAAAGSAHSGRFISSMVVYDNSEESSLES
jgi:hypothetical protein